MGDPEERGCQFAPHHRAGRGGAAELAHEALGAGDRRVSEFLAQVLHRGAAGEPGGRVALAQRPCVHHALDAGLAPEPGDQPAHVGGLQRQPGARAEERTGVVGEAEATPRLHPGRQRRHHRGIDRDRPPPPPADPDAHAGLVEIADGDRQRLRHPESGADEDRHEGAVPAAGVAAAGGAAHETRDVVGVQGGHVSVFDTHGRPPFAPSWVAFAPAPERTHPQRPDAHVRRGFSRKAE